MLAILEITVQLLLAYFFIIKVVLPIWRGTPVKTAESKENELQDRLALAKQKSIEVDLENEIDRTEEVAAKKRRVKRPIPMGPATSGPEVKKEEE